MRASAQEARAQAVRAHDFLPTSLLLTIPEAARQLHVTVWHVLIEPDLQARLIERTRKVGIYYKFIPLLPPDLMTDLPAHFADKRSPGHGDEP